MTISLFGFVLSRQNEKPISCPPWEVTHPLIPFHLCPETSYPIEFKFEISVTWNFWRNWWRYRDNNLEPIDTLIKICKIPCVKQKTMYKNLHRKFKFKKLFKMKWPGYRKTYTPRMIPAQFLVYCGSSCLPTHRELLPHDICLFCLFAIAWPVPGELWFSVVHKKILYLDY